MFLKRYIVINDFKAIYLVHRCKVNDILKHRYIDVLENFAIISTVICVVI